MEFPLYFIGMLFHEYITIFPILQEQIQCQSQKRQISPVSTLSGHEKQQQDHQKILRVQIRRKQIPKIASGLWRTGTVFRRGLTVRRLR